MILTENRRIPLWHYIMPSRVGRELAKRDTELDIKREKEELFNLLQIQAAHLLSKGVKEEIEELLDEDIALEEKLEKIENIIGESSLYEDNNNSE